MLQKPTSRPWDDAGVYGVIALRRYHRDEPPDADPAPARSSNRWPQRNLTREVLASADGKAIYKLRKQTVEPVFGQIKAARGFRQFLRRGLSPDRMNGRSSAPSTTCSS